MDGSGLTNSQFREHESLGGKTPAEWAKLKVPFQTWADVVESAWPMRVVPEGVVVKPEGKGRRSISKPTKAAVAAR